MKSCILLESLIKLSALDPNVSAFIQFYIFGRIFSLFCHFFFCLFLKCFRLRFLFVDCLDPHFSELIQFYIFYRTFSIFCHFFIIKMFPPQVSVR